MRSIVDGKRVVVVDDSLVRGTTSRKIVKMLRNAGAREVHLRISAPPTTHPCFYGIDTPTRSELVAASHTIEEIGRYVTCDSIAYLSHAGMMAAVGAERAAKRGVLLGVLHRQVPASRSAAPELVLAPRRARAIASAWRLEVRGCPRGPRGS